ncbi:MAG TPA: hypothetical protein VKZ58_13765 [Longimicrobiales bacterium]|nr:hypothetical protein [Longimicrobiales bacterium]
MSTPLDPVEQGRDRFEEWVAEQVRSRWPGAHVHFRDRAMNGSYHWQIDVPEVGEFHVAATEDVLADEYEIERAEDSLVRELWLERLPDVPTRAAVVKPGGRVFGWNPVSDTTIGPLE